MVNEVVKFLQDSRDVAADVVGLIKEVIEPIHPPFDPRTQFATCMVMTSSVGFGWDPGIRADLEDHVFRGQESVPQELFNKRVEEFRKKHPATFTPIEDMHEKVYGTREWEENGEKITATVAKARSGGTLITTFKRHLRKVTGITA